MKAKHNNREYILGLFEQLNTTGIAVKDHHRRRQIIGYLSRHESATINEVATAINISVPKITVMFNELQDDGFLTITGKQSEGPGRKATYYGLAGHSCYFLGIEIKKYRLSLGLMGFDKNIIHSEENSFFYSDDASHALSEIIEIVRKFLDGCEINHQKIIGIGVSISGRINVRTGEILTIYHFSDAPVKKHLEEAFGIPVHIDNDSRTLAYGEYHFGKRTNESEALVLNLDYGLALGIFVKGQPVYGASGYAGELGHIPIFQNEKICFCGKKGCLETEAAGRPLIEYLQEQMKAGTASSLTAVLANKEIIEIEDVVEAVHRGDNLALKGVTRMADKLGLGLAVTLNLLNPQLIILSGSLSAVGESLLLPVKTSLLQHSLNIVNADTRVALSNLHGRAGLLGTCLLVRDKIIGLVEQNHAAP